MMGSQSFPHVLSTPSTICPPIPSHLSSLMFPLGERIPTSLSWRRSVRGPLLNPHWLHPPQRREMICLSFKDKMVSLPVFLFLYSFIFGCAGSSLLHRLFSSCSEWGLLFVEVCGLLIAVASLVADHGLQNRGSRVVAHGLISSVTCGIFLDQE